jgi:hypothetical protein
MVPIAALGRPITESPLMSIEPEVSGTYRWYGTKTLSFEPDVPLTGNPSYKVSVSRKAESLGGNRLDRAFWFEIFTERLAVVNVYAGTPEDPYTENHDVPVEYARQIVLEFNQQVDPHVLTPSISIEAGGRKRAFVARHPSYPEELASRSDRALLLTLREDPPEQSAVRVTLHREATPQQGFPEADREFSHYIRTIAEFRAGDLNSYRSAFPVHNRSFDYPVFLDFSHSLAEGTADQEFLVTLDDQAVEPSEIRASYSRLLLYIPNARPGQTVRVVAPATVTDVHGRTLGTEAERTYTIPRPRPEISFPSHPSGLRHLEAEFSPLFVYTTRNIASFRLGMERIGAFFSRHATPTPEEHDISAHLPDYVYLNPVDLSPYLNRDGYGTVAVSWHATKDPKLISNPRYRSSSGSVAVQVTDLGITTRYAYNRILVWVNRLSDGSPVAGAGVEAFNRRSWRYTAETDSDGLAVIPVRGNHFATYFFTDFMDDDDDLHLRVRNGTDVAELRVASTHSASRFGAIASQRATRALVERHRVHLYTDRGIYKPGEDLAYRGIHWVQDANGFTPFGSSYSIEITHRQSGETIWKRSGRPSMSGGVFDRLRLPEDAEHGDYVLRYTYGEGNRDYEDVPFYVGSFRRAAFEVTSRLEAEPVVAGESASVSVAASYLSGGALAGAGYEYFWFRKPVRYVPPGPQWEDWTVGTGEWGSEGRLSGGDGSLSSAGTATISVATAEQELAGKSYRYTLETRVEDVDRQVVAHSTSLLVHPANHYVAARFVHGSADGYWSRFVATEEPIVAEARLVGIDGAQLADDGKLRYGLIKEEWKSAQQQGLYGRLSRRWEYVEETLFEGVAPLSQGSYRYELVVDDPGRYVIFFESTDAAGRSTRTEIPFYATGSGWVQTASQTPSDIDLVVDKSLYEPGETARILVQSPLPEGRYLLTIEREGILEQRVVELSGSHEVIEVPVDASYVPVVYVALTSFTERTQTEDDYFEPDLGKPRGLFGITSVSVATTPVELDVEVSSESPSYGPGDPGDISVRVTRNGEPVADAEVTILGVDRGVLDLIDYHVPDPIEFFYSPWHFPLGVEGDDSRRLLLRPVTYDISTLQGGDVPKLEERADFTPLALFEPEATTDESGYARVSFEYPDNLTTYRFTAVALKGNRLGLDEHEVMVRNAINVRTALPRRFRTRDTAVAGVVLTNTSETDHDVEVSVESDILSIADETTKAITIPAGSAYELPFVLEALASGEGVIRFTTRGELLNEVLEESVLVEQPVVDEAFSTSGKLGPDTDGRVIEGLMIPSTIAEDYGSLSISLGTSLRPHIEPSIDRLSVAPTLPSSDIRLLYDLSLAAHGLRELGGRERVLHRMKSRQFMDGGLGFRVPATEFAEPSHFLSLLTAQILRQAVDSGIELQHSLDTARLHQYLKSRLGEARTKGRTTFLSAWTASILAAAGEVSGEELQFLLDAGDSVGIAGNALLAEAYLSLDDVATAKSVYRRLKNLVEIGTQTVDLRQTYEARGYFDTGESELALMLRIGTLLGDSQRLLLRLAASLNRDRTNRRFHSTHDDFWIVHGFAPLLSRETKTRGVRTAVLLGDTALFEGRIGAEHADSIHREFPLFEGLLADAPRDEMLWLELLTRERGPVYYTNTLRYSLPSETSIPRDEGIEVRVQFETLDGEILEGHVLPLGESIRVRVFLSTTRRHSYVNLHVPIPSGAEILDPNLVTSGSYGESGGLQSEQWTRETVYGDTVTAVGDGYASYGPAGWWFWFYRPVQQVYDSAMTYMWEDFYAGQRDVSFLIRTTSPGVFPTPPTQAFLEFEPEVFGRSEGRLFVIREEGE